MSVLASGWLASSVLRGFSAAGLGPVSLLLLIGAALITAAAVRAAAALPRGPLAEPGARPCRYHGKQEAGTPCD